MENKSLNQIWIDVCTFKEVDPIHSKINRIKGKKRDGVIKENSRPYKYNLRYANKYQRLETKPIYKVETKGVRALFTQIAFSVGYRLKDLKLFFELDHSTVLYYKKYALIEEELNFLNEYIKPSN